MDSLEELLSKPDLLLTLAPEELAGPLLTRLAQYERPGAGINPGNFYISLENKASDDVRKACMEALAWLVREGMLAPFRGADWLFITRRGLQLLEAKDFSRFRHSALLPRDSLHPLITQKVWSAFIRGEYDSAVFEAFRQVEVAVSGVAPNPDDKIGVALMRQAFNVETGPLMDPESEKGERQALSDLFAGAIGYCKNPYSHRNVSLSDPKEAAELISVANYLLRIVDTCRGRYNAAQFAN